MSLTVIGTPSATPLASPKLLVMSERTTPDSASTLGPLEPSPGYGPAVSSGISPSATSTDESPPMPPPPSGGAPFGGPPAVPSLAVDVEDGVGGAPGQGGDADPAEDRQHPAPGEALPLDDPGQVVGEPEVVVLELVVGAVVFAHAPSGTPTPVCLLCGCFQWSRKGGPPPGRSPA